MMSMNSCVLLCMMLRTPESNSTYTLFPNTTLFRSLLDSITGESRLMPHLHLTLQAGDDMILKRMKRRHDRRQSIDFCARVRKARPDVAFGADLLAGVPTETDAMFEKDRTGVGEGKSVSVS